MSKDDQLSTSGSETDAEIDWIYRESTKKMLMRGLLIACGISVLLELFVLDRNGHFGFDGIFGFYAFLGFVACSAMIFLAKALGFVLKKPTDFYTGEEDGK